MYEKSIELLLKYIFDHNHTYVQSLSKYVEFDYLVLQILITNK